MATKKRSCWLWLEDRLYSFCAECSIIVLTLVSVLAVATEMLIGLQIISAPNSMSTSQQNAGADSGSTANSTPGSVDPGGEEATDPGVRTAELVCHYISLAIAGAFMLEICLKMVVRNRDFFRDCWQIFDAAVVIVTLALEILLSVLHSRSEYSEAATFVVILRLWRLNKVCNMKSNKWNRENEIEIYQYEEKRKDDEVSKHLQVKLDKQEKEIKRLESMLRRYQQDNNIDSNRNNTETLLEILESKEPFDRYAEVKSNSIIETATQEAAQFRSSRTVKAPNGHVPADREGTDDLHDMGCTNSESDMENIPYSSGDPRLFRVDSESSMSQDGGLTTVHNVMVDVEGGGDRPGAAFVDVEGQTDTNTAKENPDREVEEGGNFAYTNQSFETDVSLDDRNWPVLSDIDGTKTYRSAEGIPMTSL